jgi:hypothetical protein
MNTNPTSLDEILQCPEQAIRKILQYEKKIAYIKRYNKEHRDKTLARNRRYYLKKRDTEEYKQKRREYYHRVTKVKAHEKKEAERLERIKTNGPHTLTIETPEETNEP